MLTPVWFSVCTFNAHDTAAPPAAVVVALQERPPFSVVHRALPHHSLFYPPKSWQVLAWDPARIHAVATRIEQTTKSGREHGRPGTTPRGYYTELRGILANGRKVAVLNCHLVNNAFGPIKRGERRLRLRLWWQAWRKIKARRRELVRDGYAVWIVGDLNRRRRFWQRLRNLIGDGYDHIIPPRRADVQLMSVWRGNPNGSDHRPLCASFKVGAP